MSTRRKVVARWWKVGMGEVDPSLRARVAWMWADQDRRAHASGNLTHADAVPECRNGCTCIARVGRTHDEFPEVRT